VKRKTTNAGRPKMGKRMLRVREAFRLDPSIHSRLISFSRLTSINKTKVVERALCEYLSKMEAMI
jgi:predicted DNA-binding protein